MKKRPEQISDRFVQTVCARIRENKRVRRKLPVWGRVHIDRQLPFLCVYRRPADRNDTGTEKLLFGEASYITASGELSVHRDLRALARGITETLSGIFGSVLIIEISSARDVENNDSAEAEQPRPVFRIIESKSRNLPPALDTFSDMLGRIKIMGKAAGAMIERRGKPSPPGLLRLLQTEELKSLRAHYIGLEVRPVYRDDTSGEVYPLLLRSFHRQFSIALRKILFEFARYETTHKAPHFLALGRRAMVKAVWNADTQLAEVSKSFDLLLYVSPINPDSAFAEFKRLRYEKTPKFLYRPRPVDPVLLKRKLYSIPIERIEDPAVANIFRETQEDIDGRVTLLSDRNSKRFLYGSLRIFGGISDKLFATARQLLDTIPPRSREIGKDGYFDAAGFADNVAEEFEYYRRRYAGFGAGYEIRGDITGLLCSRGNLLIGKNVKIAKSRARALIQHEVGTHLLTYYNGRAQPFKQLYLGLAGYDELQEGLAVFSEYLVDGLSRPRMRLLAARVIAVRMLLDGASFIDTFRELTLTYGFEKRTAFTIVMRVYRGGGFTKDAAYMKGLVKLLRFLKDGGDLRDLFIGKFNIHHVDFIKELMWRNILHTPPLRPRYLDETQVQQKLEDAKSGLSPSDLLEKKIVRRTKS